MRAVFLVLTAVLAASANARAMASTCELHLTYAGQVTLELRQAIRSARPTQRLLAELFVGQQIAFSKEFRRELAEAGLAVVETSGEPGGLQRVEVAGSAEALSKALLEATETSLAPIFRKVVLAAMDHGPQTFKLAFDSLITEVRLAAGEHVLEPALRFEEVRTEDGEAVVAVTVARNPWLASKLRERFRHYPLAVRQSDVSNVLAARARRKVSPGLKRAVESSVEAELQARVVLDRPEVAWDFALPLRPLAAPGERNVFLMTASPRALVDFLEQPFVVEATLAAEPVHSPLALRGAGSGKVQVNLHLSEQGRRAVRDFLSEFHREATLVFNGRWYEGSDFVEYYPRVSKMDVRVRLPANLLAELVARLDSSSHLTELLPASSAPPRPGRLLEDDRSGEL